MPTVNFNDDTAALDYIRKRGYASYSSIRMVKYCAIPSTYSGPAQIFGKELHSRFLEKKRLQKLSKEQEIQISGMMDALDSSLIVKRLMRGCKVEQKFETKLLGLNVLGYIDILGADVSDLKTTSHTNMVNFAKSMDFLQAALYLAVTGKKNFYYIGITKIEPYTVLPFNVCEHPKRMELANKELKRLVLYIKSKL